MTDDILRELLQQHPNPIEKFASDHRKHYTGGLIALETLTERFLKTGKRIVVLECGHYALTKALHKAACPRCGQMIRSGYDYDGFRRLGMPDQFSWPDDPLAALNESGDDDDS